MRVHIQNAPQDPLFAITAADWQEAAGRAGQSTSAYALTIGETPMTLAAALRTAEALIAPPASLAACLPVPAPDLRLIFCTTAGVDALAPFDRLPPRALLVCNRGIHGAKAGEFGIMAVLMLAMRLPALVRAQSTGTWEPHYTPIVADRRLLLVGLGTLGSAVAARARSFGMHVTGVTLSGRSHVACDAAFPVAELDAVLPRAEFLLLACPLTPHTNRLIDRRRLALLPSGAGVVNIGRGAVLDEQALADLLGAGHLGGAVLDVFSSEPLPRTHLLWQTPNLIVTPHISADDPSIYTPRTLDRFFAALEALRNGATPDNTVDLVRGY